MSYTIDISKDNIRQYTSEELRDLADKGLLYVHDFCLSEFVNKILVDCISKEDLDIEKDKAYNEGYRSKVNTCEIERAISILQDFVDCVEDGEE